MVIKLELWETYGLVLGLLILVTLLVGGSLLIVRLALGLGQSLPLVTEHLSDLACEGLDLVQ